MKDEEYRFLSLLGHLPARLTVGQVAWVLGCQAHDVPILIASRLLKPLGSPPPNGTKFFATAEVEELAKDRSWLAKVTQAITRHWHDKNERQRNSSAQAIAHERVAA